MGDLQTLHSTESLEAVASERIYLFESSCARRGGLNTLKEFMTFLKFRGGPLRIEFSLAGSLETLHANLSIKENYILDSVPTSLIKDREDNFTLTTKNLKNQHLKTLIEQTSCLERKAGDLSDKEKKIVSIVKGLLSQSEHLFLEGPDHGLEIKDMKLVKAALLFEAKTNKRCILIRPHEQEKWLDLAGNFVTRPPGGPYKVTDNELARPVMYDLDSKKAA